MGGGTWEKAPRESSWWVRSADCCGCPAAAVEPGPRSYWETPGEKRKTHRTREGAHLTPLSHCCSVGTCITMVMPLLALVFLRWLCNSLVVPSWKVLGRAPRSMVNSGVLSSNRAISTTWAACRRGHTHRHTLIMLGSELHSSALRSAAGRELMI